MIHRLPKHKLIQLLEAATPEQEWVLDTETNGLDVMGQEAPHYAWWIGLSPLGSPSVFIISREEYDDWGLSEWFKRLRLVGHNLRFDLHALDLVPEVAWKDTMVAAYFAHTSGKRSMDHIARMNGWTNIETPNALKQGRIAEMFEPELFEYLENDCIITSKMAKKLPLHSCPFDYKVEQAVYGMERRGLRLLLDKLGDVACRLDEMIKSRLHLLRHEGLEGNPDSPIQVAEWLLSRKRKLPLTATGKPSTSKLALQQLVDNGDDLADAIIQYRKAIKLKTSFVEPLPQMAQDGILYPRTNGIIACDFSQVELRVAAAFAGEPVLLDAFERGHCPHTEVAAKMVGKRVEDVTTHERFKAKAVNFGILNGMGAKRLAIELKTDRREALKFLTEYKRNLSRLNEWMEGIWREAESFQIARTVAGRTRIFTSNEGTRSAVSVVVQGSAAELIRHSLVAVHEAGLEPLLTVHDEIIVGDANEIKAEMLREVMEDAANRAYTGSFGSVKFLAEATLGDTWGDA